MTMSKRARLLFAATVLAAGAGGIALAQNGGGTYDPAQLPVTKGRVAQYSLTPRGDVDGLILDDGTEILLPPHLGTQLVAVAKPGDAVTIHGLKARGVAMVQAMQVTNDGTNKSVTDAGPPPAGPDRARMAGAPGPGGAGPAGPDGGPGRRGADGTTSLEAQGVIKEQLHGPRGDVNGVLLQDGTIVRLPPPAAASSEGAFMAGKPLFVRGDGTESALGRVIRARMVGTSAQDAVALPTPPTPVSQQPGAPQSGAAPTAAPPATARPQ